MLNIAIAGLGTVGCGLIEMINSNKGECPVNIVAVSAHNKNKHRLVDISPYEWVDHALDFAKRDDIDCVIELIGGSEGIAHDLVKSSLATGKMVITANKALIADHGYELAAIAEEKDVFFGYEAAVAGGIPVIKALRESFSGNYITAIRGILNGTCNYILTTMRESGRDFKNVLKEAQDLGYAESDPTFDIEGIDAGHKLAILAALGFGVKVPFNRLDIRGITALSPVDSENADKAGYSVKLLGLAERSKTDGITLSVEPCFVSKSNALAHVEGVLNAVQIDCEPLGRSMLVGAGAGAGPTASSVYADVLDAALHIKRPLFGKNLDGLSDLSECFEQDKNEQQSRYYMRLRVEDRAGVIAELAQVLKDYDISISDMEQRGHEKGKDVDLIIVTYDIAAGKMKDAAQKLQQLAVVKDNPVLLRILNE